MSIKETIEAIKTAPDNLIYVEPEGRIQLNGLRELAEAYEELVNAGKECIALLHRAHPATANDLSSRLHQAVLKLNG